ncbi:MAG: hypothetical protein AB2989_06360 [Candidatus Symbiodolus clandestinus]
MYLLVRAYQSLWLSAADGAYDSSLNVNPMTQPSLSAACDWPPLPPRSRLGVPFPGVHCQEASHPAVTSGALSLGYG